MSDFLSFDMPLPCELRIKLTRKAIASSRELGRSQSWFAECSRSPRVMITCKPEDQVYFIHIGGCIFNCCINTEDHDSSNKFFLAMSVSPESYSQKNNALNSGLCFYCEKGIIISYFTQENNFCYKSGGTCTSVTANRNYAASTHFIVNSFTALSKYQKVEEEEYQPSQELMYYLNLAKQYSLTEHLLEVNRSMTNEPLRYSKIEGCDYARIANSAYRFFVDRIDEKIYPLNAKVEVTDINDEKLRATIIDFGTDEEKRTYIDLLFNEQVSLGNIQNVGSITLSLSTVNKDVQQKAIEKIIDGTADAKYMSYIFDEGMLKGFDDVDLSSLKNDLASKKYPPNKSQIDGIEKGICTKDIYLVMGPPGTGKTTVILEWIKYFVKNKNMRVLISSQNNKAVDNVLERIIGEDGIEPLRIGTESKVTESVKDYLFDAKLKGMRDRIKETTDNHKTDIKVYSDYWRGICNALETLSEDYRLKAELEGELDKACANLATIYDEISKTVLKHADIKTKTLLKAEKINSLIDKENQYLSKGAFMRFLLFIASFIRKLRISMGISSYDKSAASLYELETMYNSQCKNYTELYDRTAFDVYAPEREKSDSILEKISVIDIDYEKKDGLGIFDLSKYDGFDITSSQFYYGMTGNIKTGISTSESLCSELTRWQEISVDTSNYTLKNILLDGINLVGATCIGINSQHRFADLKFDVTIIDEAGQIQIHNALVPMSVSNKVIMLGDHKQIPPMADDELVAVLKEHGIPTNLLEKSLFEELYNMLPESNKSMLDTQYRMPAEIADIISEWFYGGNYKSFSGKRNMETLLPFLSKCPFLIIDTSKSENRFERSIQSGEQTVHDNPLEASIASQIADVLNKNDYDMNNVGIIAALKAQVDLIRKQLKSKGISSEVANELAATLDSYQGQERDIIIYSFSRSSNKAADKNGVGFLTELRRLNVAMSRCKKALIMIGDMSFLRSRESTVDYMGEQIMDEEKTEKNFSRFIDHMLTCVENGAGEIIDVDQFNQRIEKWKA